MLTVRYETNQDCKKIYEILGVNEEVIGTNFIMYDVDAPVALFRIRLQNEEEPVAIIDKIHFLDSVEEGDKTFFIHAIFYKLIDGAPIKLRILGIKEEYKKFGFEEVNGNMEIISKDINLHYMCGKI